jgi:hypothetical protein
MNVSMILIELPTGKRKPARPNRGTVCTYLRHHESRARRRPRRRRAEHSRRRRSSSRPNLPLLLLGASPWPCQLASSPRRGPTATRTSSDRQPRPDHISTYHPLVVLYWSAPTRCTRASTVTGGEWVAMVLLLRSAEREEGKDSGRRLDPVNTNGAGGRAEPSAHARASAIAQSRLASDQ